jgi:cobalamin biosynthesis Mg chelatase CobN
MHREGDKVHVSTEEASGGVQGHGVRYVLIVGLLLAILLLSAIWITGTTLG